MKEDLLHYVWRLQNFHLKDLKTTAGETIDIIHFGSHHHHSGPDFFNARIKIGATEWVGNVEMHIKSSDWLKHQHDKDEAYNNVILHVVYEEDIPIYRKTKEKIPCLELKRRIPQKISNHYLRLMHNETQIPCENLLSNIPNFYWNKWLERLLIERLEHRVTLIDQTMNFNISHREEVFYQLLAKSFGSKINSIPFERLSRSLPLKILAKHQNNLFSIEALLFGQAGMLQKEFKEEYPQQLKKEYQFLQKKYNLKSIHLSEWKILRMRPANFPTIRIAQFAALIFQSNRLWSYLLDCKNIKEITTFFQVEVSDYWLNHYVFDKESMPKSKKLGLSTIYLFAINTIIPFMFHYGKEQQNERIKNKAIQLFFEIPPEKNHIISMWKQLQIVPKNAANSQALLHLKNNYCDKKRCLNCMIGHQILHQREVKEIVKSSSPM